MKLDDISCEAVSDIPEGLREKLLNDFSNKRNSGLVKKLCNYLNETARYYIVYYDSTPLFYFSLQASCLFIKEYTPPKRDIEAAKMLKAFLASPEDGKVKNNKLEILEILYKNDPQISNKIRSMNKIEKVDLLNTLYGTLDYLSDINDPDTEELSIYENTIPALEIVEFCKCDSSDSSRLWDSLNLKRSIGEYVFFTYIFPIIENVSKQIGCSLVFLYAADDSSKERTLVEYYIRALHLFKPRNATINKPKYDLGCILLVQYIDRLKEFHQIFLNTFKGELQNS